MEKYNSITKFCGMTVLLAGLMIPAYGRNTGQEPEGDESVPEIMFRTDKQVSTASVSVVSGERMFRTPTTNSTSTLFGLASGLQVWEGSGEPGDNAATMYIRGLGTFQAANSYTVFVDGFQTDMSYAMRLLPTEIANLYVLKDGAALSTFGMKGANGVLWIETRRGHIGKTRIDVDIRQGFQKPLVVTKPLGSADYASFYNEAYSNDNGRIWNPPYSDSQINSYRNATGIDTDWYDEVLRSAPSPFTSVDASFSGGDNTMRYFATVGYMRSLGAIDNKRDKDDRFANVGYEQYTVRANFDVSFLNFLEARVDLGGHLADRNGPNYSMAALFSDLERYPNNIYRPLDSDQVNPDGSLRWSGTSVHPNNPLASVRALGTESLRDRSIQANLTLKQNLDMVTPGLYLQESASFANWIRGGRWNSRNYTRWMDGVEQTNDRDGNYTIGDDNGMNQWRWNQFRVQTGYSRSFGLHSVVGALKYEHWRRYVDENMNNYYSGNLQMDYAFQNVAGRLNYSYDGRYAAEFGFAYSGSDNFRKGNRFVFYPSISGAWIVSGESFLSASTIVDLLKLRFSWGRTGDDYTVYGRYLFSDYWGWTGNYPLGGMGGSDPSWIAGLTPQYMVNRNITAEKSDKYNIGLDAHILKGLDITVDAYLDKRTGIVVRDDSYSSVTGVAVPYTNAGKVTSRGIEFDLKYSARAEQVNFSIGGLGALISDKIVFSGEIPPASAFADPVGNRIWTYFGYDAVGFYDVGDFNADGTLGQGVPVPNFGSVQPGDIKYRDVDGDGYINEKDMVRIGNRSIPDLYYSFYGSVDFKGFDFSFLFQGMAGRDVNLLDAWNKFVPFENYSTVYGNADKSWAYYPEQGIDRRADALFPRLSLESNTNNYRNSSVWIKKGGFLKLRNIEIGYSLPDKIASKLGMYKARVYVNGVNLLTFSKLYRRYDIDPERMTGYPAVKSFNFGISVGF